MMDLHNQYMKLWRRSSFDRQDKLNEIYHRYATNIQNRDPYQQEARRVMLSAYNRGDMDAAQKIADVADNKKYSRRVYMGLSNG